MKAILIARVSTEEQREAGNSLPAQMARLESYCHRKGFSILQTCSFDTSAYKAQRNEFDLILEQKEKTAICCDKVDRTKAGWEERIRTSVAGTRIQSPATRRLPKHMI